MNISMKLMKRLHVAIILGMTTLLMPTEGMAKKQDLEPIILTENSNTEGNGPRSKYVSITAAYNASLGLIYAQTENAGTDVYVQIKNLMTDVTYNYVMGDTETARFRFDASASDWTITFTLADGDVYYGSFSANIIKKPESCVSTTFSGQQ